jgi:very-short-patch-repair endonuclease
MGAIEMRNQAFSTTHSNARKLRRAMTDSERALWSRLRGEQLGVKFRRQHPLGTYVADFACLAPKMIVELDGSQHEGQAGYDARRDAFFRAHGFQVLRFPSDAAFTNIDGILTVILDQLGSAGERPHPNPPPVGEGANSWSHP